MSNFPLTNNSSTDYAIHTHGLTKYYGSKAAVNQLDLAIPRGSVFAFLGRNGSGKTTTIRMLLGFEEPTRGSARVLGCDPQQLTPLHRDRIGYLTESHFAYGWMTINECERFSEGTFGHWNRDIFNTVIQHFGLERKARVKHLSRGERAGVCLAMTLAPEPELLVLDDPALGLDPVARRGLLEAMLYVTRDDSRTILFSSHLIDDVERVADHVAILDRGVLRVQCAVEDFRRQVGAWVLRYSGPPPELPAINGLLGISSFPGEMRVTVARELDEADSILRSLNNVDVERVEVSMEDAVVNYMDDRGKRRTLLQAMSAKQPRY